MRRNAALCLLAGLCFAPAALAGGEINDLWNAHNKRAMQAIGANPKLAYVPNTVIVQFKPGTPDDARETSRASVKGQKVLEFKLLPDTEVLETQLSTDDAIAFLQMNPFVSYAEPDYVQRKAVNPNDTHFGLLWGMHNTGQSIPNNGNGTPDADIDAPEGWDVSTGDPNFLIADTDTGMQYTHVDLAANVWTNPGEIANNGVDDDGNGYIDDVRGWDFYSNDKDPADSDGHGTHTAGTIGAVGNNGTGVSGVAWKCKLIPLRFLGPGGGSTTNAILALQYAVNKNVKVSNNSWGGGGFSQSLLNAINNSKSVGHVYCAAAGNFSSNTDSSPFYPASYNADNIISVAATTNKDAKASFSNWGKVTVDLGAPGQGILSTWPTNNYAYLDGTSMACPHVTGVVALVYAKNPGWTYQQVRTQIFNTVRKINALNNITVTGGVVNLQNAIGLGSPPNAPTGLTQFWLSFTHVQIKWTDTANNEKGFEVQKEELINGQWTNQQVIGTTGPDVTSLIYNAGPPGVFVRVRVRAFNDAGQSAWTNWMTLLH